MLLQLAYVERGNKILFDKIVIIWCTTWVIKGNRVMRNYITLYQQKTFLFYKNNNCTFFIQLINSILIQLYLSNFLLQKNHGSILRYINGYAL